MSDTINKITFAKIKRISNLRYLCLVITNNSIKLSVNGKQITKDEVDQETLDCLFLITSDYLDNNSKNSENAILLTQLTLDVNYRLNRLAFNKIFFDTALHLYENDKIEESNFFKSLVSRNLRFLINSHNHDIDIYRNSKHLGSVSKINALINIM